MKRHKFSIIYAVVLVSFTIYMALDTFVISNAYQTDAGELNIAMFDGNVRSLGMEEGDIAEDINTDNESNNTSKEEITDNEADNSTEKTDSDSVSNSDGEKGKSGKSRKHSKHEKSTTDTENSGSQNLTSADYENGEIGSFSSSDANITLTKYDYEGTAVYVADVTLSSAEYIKTAFADGTYGKNITETTSAMADDNNAVLAINGDNYGSQESGYVIRNGVVYRGEAGSSDVLCIYADGKMEVIDPAEYTADELVEKGVWQAFSFGPALVDDGNVSVTQQDEVGKAKASNPRTAIGIIDDLHYMFVVSDGRTDTSEGLSLYELASFMKSLGATCAYNLDGGGSSTMVFKGEVINNPTTSGNSIKERKVNDIVYIG